MKTVTIDGLEWVYDEEADAYSRMFGCIRAEVYSPISLWYIEFSGFGVEIITNTTRTLEEACDFAVQTLKDIKALAERIEV